MSYDISNLGSLVEKLRQRIIIHQHSQILEEVLDLVEYGIMITPLLHDDLLVLLEQLAQSLIPQLLYVLVDEMDFSSMCLIA